MKRKINPYNIRQIEMESRCTYLLHRNTSSLSLLKQKFFLQSIKDSKILRYFSSHTI